MNFKTKLKIATIAFVFLLILSPKAAKAANNHCSCATGTWPSYTYIGASIDVADADACDQECANRSATVYCYNTPCIVPADVTKSKIAPPATSSQTTSSQKQTFIYTPMEEIPGFGKPTSDIEFILAVYKFGLWTIGIAAVLMISIGAFMYITSAGNTSTVTKAKGFIFDAIAGVILALTSYILLYTINPALVAIKSTDQIIESAARKYDGTYPTIDSPLPVNCNSEEWQVLFTEVAASSGLDKCLLEAVAAKESSCNQQPSRTNGGQDCGAMQTRASGCPGAPSCADLETNPKKALECGAHYLSKNYINNRTAPDPTGEQKIRDLYAGYNGGPGALSLSSSCPSSMLNSYGNPYEKWDCPNDCGGYCPVPARTSAVLNFYKKCKAK